MRRQRSKSAFAIYRGRDGAIYHEVKHGGGRFVDETIAKSRAQKLQPFVKNSDVVLEFGVGTGYNLMQLNCREKIGYDVAEYCRAKVEPKGIYFTR